MVEDRRGLADVSSVLCSGDVPPGLAAAAAPGLPHRALHHRGRDGCSPVPPSSTLVSGMRISSNTNVYLLPDGRGRGGGAGPGTRPAFHPAQASPLSASMTASTW